MENALSKQYLGLKEDLIDITSSEETMAFVINAQFFTMKVSAEHPWPNKLLKERRDHRRDVRK
jgi:hypothetical protein